MEIIYYVALFTLTIAIYFLSVWGIRKAKLKFMHPVILATALIILFLVLSDTPYRVYFKATLPITWLLGPSVVALGWVMYNHLKDLKENLKRLLFTSFMGAICSILIVIGMSKLFDLPEMIQNSLVPKSITTPLAMQVSNMIGGNPSITIAVVVVTGILGVTISPLIYKLFKIESPMAQGIGLGVASHAIGTAAALELGALQGAVSGMAIGVMGVFTAFLAPLLCLLLS